MFANELRRTRRVRHSCKARTPHLKYFKTFDELRLSVINVFRKYMSDAAKVIKVMKKLRDSVTPNFPIDSFSGK